MGERVIFNGVPAFRRIDPASMQNPDDGFTRFYETWRGIAHAGDPRRLSTVAASVKVEAVDFQPPRRKEYACPRRSPSQILPLMRARSSPSDHRCNAGQATFRSSFSSTRSSARVARCVLPRILSNVDVSSQSSLRFRHEASSNHLASARPTRSDHQGKLRTCV